MTPSSPQSFYLTRQCVNGIENADHQDIFDDMENWLDEQSDYLGENSAYSRRQMIYKYMLLRQTDLKTHYSRLVFPQRCNFRVTIQPGLFKVIKHSSLSIYT